ncbi:hypothetical protein QUA54_01345 [Microcoleus sp. MOSTC5]|uniref:hypothetical protein n=1 Tax=Microcoleus sp. MOSTC5 TaxID=3055378 RepID=UPI002FD58B13
MLTLEAGDLLKPTLALLRRKLQAIVQRAKQDPAFREQLLTWEKTASDCDLCSVMGEAVRFAIGLLWRIDIEVKSQSREGRMPAS